MYIYIEREREREEEEEEKVVGKFLEIFCFWALTSETMKNMAHSLWVRWAELMKSQK